MFYVFALISQVKRDFYIGSCRDLQLRYYQHNKGEVVSTKAFRSWIIVYYEAYKSKNDATVRERRLKMHAVKEELKSRLTYNFECA